MKQFLRVACIGLCLLMVTALFGACGKKGGNSSDDSGLSASEYAGEVLSKNDVNYVTADGGSTYRVVRPNKASADVSNAAMTVFKALRSAFNVTPDNVTDDESGENAAEILIGETNREATAEAKQLLSLDGTDRSVEYIICTIDDDIVIYGMSDAATATAAQYFVDNYMKEATVAGGINYFYNASADFTNVKIGDCDRISKFQIVRPIYNVSYLTQTETDKLIETIASKTGYDVSLVHDQVASNNGNKLDGSGTLTPTEAAEYEIIIGNCVRDGVNTISDYNKYEIRIEDNKVYLNGGSSHATAMAVSEFIKMIEGNTEITASMSVADGDYNAAAANYDSAEYYKPTFWEDFDYSDNGDFGIDYTKWDVVWGRQSGYANAGEGKKQYRNNKERKNCYVEDGKLYMVAIETDTEYWGGWFDTTSTMFYRYGFIETSSLHPRGNGFWSSLWMRSRAAEFENILPECKDAIVNLEVDVDECYGPGDYSMGNTFIWPTPLGASQYGLDEGTAVFGKNNTKRNNDDRGFWMDFHTYGYEWLDNVHLRFICDGDVYYEQTLEPGYQQMAFIHPAYLIIGYAVGSGEHGEPTKDPDCWNNTNKWITDYIYIYQKTGQEMFKLINGKWTDVGVWNTH